MLARGAPGHGGQVPTDLTYLALSCPSSAASASRAACKRQFRSVTKSRFTVLQIGRAGQGS